MKPETYSQMSNLVYLETTDSTNEEAKRLAKLAEEGLMVVAGAQTAGKGRKGKTWISPPGKNLYFSLLLKPDFAPDRASMLTLLMAVAVKRAIDALYVSTDAREHKDSAAEKSKIQIKWPNDLVAGGKKLVGILTEMQLAGSSIDYVVIGVGVNVKKQDFEQNICAHATDLETVFGKTVSFAELLSAIQGHFTDAYRCFRKTCDLSGLMAEYNEVLVNAGRQVRIFDPKGTFDGVAEGIDEKGELLVQTKDGIKKIYAGEVSVRGVYDYV